MSQSTEELIAENERLQRALVGSRGTLDTWTSGLGSAARGLGGFAAAALSGEEKLSSYTSHLGTMTSGLGGAGAALTGSFGLIAGYIDNTTATFQKISGAGFQLEDGLTGVGRQSARSGMQIEQFGKFVTDNSDMLRTMGSSGTGAIKTFGDMSKSFREDTSNYSQGLRRLGFSTEEINESLVGFAAINRTQYLENIRTGTSQNRSAMEFALQMDRMAQLTGENRKELQKEMDAKRRDGRVQAYLRTETGALADTITKSLATVGSFDKNAQTLLEDILVQGSVTKESAAAAAFYGTEVTNAAHAMRAAQQAQDPDAYAAAQRRFINGMAVAQNDQERLRVARYRTDSAYINNIQDSIGEFTPVNDRIAAELAKSGIDMEKASAAQLRAAMGAIQDQGVVAQTAAGVTEAGAVDGVGDGLTNTASSVTDAINTVSGATREQLVNVLTTKVGPSLRGFSTTVDETAQSLITTVESLGGGLSGALNGQDSASLVEGATVDTQTSAAEQALAAATAALRQEGIENGLTPEQLRQMGNAADMLSGLINSINPQGNFMGGTAIGGMMNLVGEQGPEFIMPNANSLVATAKQFADKARPQMEQMAASMGPQMEQMASQMRPQMEDMAQQMRSQFGQGTQNGQSVEALVARLETGFTSLVKEMQNNNREVRKLTGNAYRV
jgi:hypothetical protein